MRQCCFITYCPRLHRTSGNTCHPPHMPVYFSMTCYSNNRQLNRQSWILSRLHNVCSYVYKSLFEFCCYLPSVETPKLGLKVSEQRKDVTNYSNPVSAFTPTKCIVLYKASSLQKDRFWAASISQLPCTDIRAQAQGHVLIADWSLPLPLLISSHVMNDVMNDNMAASAHFGARLGAFFYWTRFLENNVPFDNIPL